MKTNREKAIEQATSEQSESLIRHQQRVQKAKKYLSDNGYGSGSNYTTTEVASLMVEYAKEQAREAFIAARKVEWLHSNRPEKVYPTFEDYLTRDK